MTATIASAIARSVGFSIGRPVFPLTYSGAPRQQNGCNGVRRRANQSPTHLKTQPEDTAAAGAAPVMGRDWAAGD
jgi:hypothetical protein